MTASDGGTPAGPGPDPVFAPDPPPPDYPDFAAIELTIGDDGVAVITLGPPDAQARATTTTAMTPELTECFRLLRDDRRIRALVITGRGHRFAAGGDIGTMKSRAAQMSVSQNPRWVRRLPVDRATDFMTALLELDVPVVAAVNGHAIGAGLRIVMLCDLVIVAERAKLGDPHVARGLVAPQASLLALLIGSLRAKSLVLSGRLLTGPEAVQFGLADQALPTEQVLAAALDRARAMAAMPPLAMRWTKRLMNNRIREAVAAYTTEGYALESLTMLSADHAEAAASFVDKRDPAPYEGR